VFQPVQDSSSQPATTISKGKHHADQEGGCVRAGKVAANIQYKRQQNIADCQDMLMYFTQHWLPNHVGPATKTWEHIAALSGLATEFEMPGRTGDWDPV